MTTASAIHGRVWPMLDSSIGQRGGLAADLHGGARGRGDVADVPGDGPGLRRVGTRAVAQVDPGDVPADAGHLRAR